MSNSFVQSAQNTQQEARTTNGMQALQSSLRKTVDLFFAAGSARGTDITAKFESAFQENADVATRIALWLRDAREGAGERQLFRDILLHLEANHLSVAKQLLPKVAELGRWDDLLIFKTQSMQASAFALIKEALTEGNGLCAKWMPRKGNVAIALRNFLGFTPKQYRKTLVTLSNTVEQLMCAKDWSNIEFAHVPSLAMSRYTKAFKRNATAEFEQYKEDLDSGVTKVNAGAIYPYDVIKSLRAGGDKTVGLAQWDSLPDYVGDAKILPLVDVSGSMHTAAGHNTNLSAIDIAISLGLYLADKNTGAFKDCFVTFTTNASVEVLKGNLIDKLNQLSRAEWGFNTNLHSAFTNILNVATTNNVAAEDMPSTLLILSDMQFNRCVAHDDSATQMINRKYTDAGYTMPNVVFWNLAMQTNTSPVTFDKSGAALVSGFSPSILKSVLGASDMSPQSIMLDTVMIDRYSY